DGIRVFHVTGVQTCALPIFGLYFWNLLRQQQTSRSAVERESRKELEKLAKLKAISLTEPLAEKTRPSRFEEIVGQEDGLKALRRSEERRVGKEGRARWSTCR